MSATFDASQALLAINGLLVRLADSQPALAIIGQRERDKVRARIQRSKDSPDGDPWAAWRPWARADREAKGNAEQGLLWDEGLLLDSIRSTSGGDAVSIGTDVGYAEYLQDGTHNMEARAFLGWSDDAAHEVEMTILNYIAGPL